jgi:hypothetical protein
MWDDKQHGNGLDQAQFSRSVNMRVAERPYLPLCCAQLFKAAVSLMFVVVGIN